MYNMTKDDLISLIQSINTDCFTVEVDATKGPETFDLPDVRTGAIYPPMPHGIKKHTKATAIRFSVEALVETAEIFF